MRASSSHRVTLFRTEARSKARKMCHFWERMSKWSEAKAFWRKKIEVKPTKALKNLVHGNIKVKHMRERFVFLKHVLHLRSGTILFSCCFTNNIEILIIWSNGRLTCVFIPVDRKFQLLLAGKRCSWSHPSHRGLLDQNTRANCLAPSAPRTVVYKLTTAQQKNSFATVGITGCDRKKISQTKHL